MIVPRIAPLVAALVLTPSFNLLAQQKEAVVDPGDRVRVAAPELFRGREVGSVVNLTLDTLIINFKSLLIVSPFTEVPDAKAGSLLSLPIGSVTSLEVSRGQKSNFGRGLLLGFAIPAGLGAILGAVEGSDSCLFDPDPCPVSLAAAGAVILKVPGALVGGVIGALSTTDRWETVQLDRLRVGTLSRVTAVLRSGYPLYSDGIGERHDFLRLYCPSVR